ELLAGEYDRKLVAAGEDAAAELGDGSGLVLLDTAVSADLAAEGVARDVIRVVQQARREGGLDVSDRIRLTLDVGDDAEAAVRANESFVANETLAESVSYGEVVDGSTGSVGDGLKVRVLVERS